MIIIFNFSSTERHITPTWTCLGNKIELILLTEKGAEKNKLELIKRETNIRDRPNCMNSKKTRNDVIRCIQLLCFVNTGAQVKTVRKVGIKLGMRIISLLSAAADCQHVRAARPYQPREKNNINRSNLYALRPLILSHSPCDLFYTIDSDYYE